MRLKRPAAYPQAFCDVAKEVLPATAACCIHHAASSGGSPRVTVPPDYGVSESNVRLIASQPEVWLEALAGLACLRRVRQDFGCNRCSFKSRPHAVHADNGGSIENGRSERGNADVVAGFDRGLLICIDR